MLSILSMQVAGSLRSLLNSGSVSSRSYTWRRQARIDVGIEPGLSTAEHAELVAARKRIRELETELAVHRRATELLKGGTSPK